MLSDAIEAIRVYSGRACQHKKCYHLVVSTERSDEKSHCKSGDSSPVVSGWHDILIVGLHFGTSPCNSLFRCDTMKKMFLCTLLLCPILRVVASPVAEDVTATYVTNPSFEADEAASLTEVTNNGRRGWTLASPKGWTVSGTDVTKLLVKADCYADNNFGLITTLRSLFTSLRLSWKRA